MMPNDSRVHCCVIRQSLKDQSFLTLQRRQSLILYVVPFHANPAVSRRIVDRDIETVDSFLQRYWIVVGFLANPECALPPGFALPVQPGAGKQDQGQGCREG